nr:unnamed protein product [Digitaria exilis]
MELALLLRRLNLFFIYGRLLDHLITVVRGRIPPSIGLLPRLKSLLLDTNGFDGSYPAEGISNLSNLKVLTLAFNPFVPAPVPEGFGKLTHLIYLWLDNMNITGEIPENLSNLSDLQLLSLAGNKIQGTIPNWIWQLKKLRYLYLYDNNFTGVIADNITALDLAEIDLSSNKLTGTIPGDFGSLPPELGKHSLLVNFEIANNNFSGISQVTELDLSGNQITGPIPMTIGVLMGLNAFNISGNQISGNIPAAFGFMSELTILDLSANALSGEIPEDFNKLRLNYLNLSMNQLSGEIPTLLRNEVYDLRFNPEHEILSGLCAQNWIGSGRSGKVYHVYVADEAGACSSVAVKRIWSLQNLNVNLEKDFHAEVQILGEIRHMNIVKLLCCISSSEAKLLVYEYMENGSLDRWLHQRDRTGTSAFLDWPTRLQIAIDSARGLCYMHHGCSPAIVHRDFKSANILLGSEFRAKVADFGFARILLKAGEPESVSAIGGTFGYMPPEYGYQRRVNEKVDVYSFRVVLLELTTGRVANGGGAEYCLAQWAWRQYQENGLSVDVLDEEIQDPVHNEDMFAVFTLALICTGEQPSMRPSMKDILHALLRFDHRSEGGSLQHAASEETALES